MIKTDRNTNKLEMSLRDVRLSERTYMTKSKSMNMTKEQVLVGVLNQALKNSIKEQKNQSNDIQNLNNACTPYLRELINQGSNIKWTISEIQNKMKELANYAPVNTKDPQHNSAFEMRVLASAEQIVLVLEGVNPNAFGQYDSKGNWKDHDATVNSTNVKNYNVKFNDKKHGFSFNKDGQLEIANKFVLPVIENDVKISDNVTKKEKFANQTETKQAVSKLLATAFFNRAYPQAKKKRTATIPESTHIENARNLKKFVEGVNLVYVDYVKSAGKSGNAERLSEEDAKPMMELRDAISEMLTNRTNAEELAFEIEEKLKAKAM